MTTPKTIANCPTCSQPVDHLHGVDETVWARPCGHRVVATVWPDRIDLEPPT